MDDYDHAAEIVRNDDRDRYLADLFAPEPARKHLLALHAFNVEISRLRDVVREPGLGEIRLQFWRDAIHGDGACHPVGRALVATIEAFGLPRETFDAIIEARRFDLYNDPMPSLNDLEGYAGETSSLLFQLAAMILSGGGDPGTAEIAGHGGVAYALTGLMRSLPLHASREQLYLPAELLSEHDVGEQSVFAGEETSGLRAALAGLRAVARNHLAAARSEAQYDPKLFPAFLPLALVEPELDRMDRPDYRPFQLAGVSQLRRQWILWRAARRRVF